MADALIYFAIGYLSLGVLISLMLYFSLSKEEKDGHFKFKTAVTVTFFWAPLLIRIWLKTKSSQ